MVSFYLARATKAAIAELAERRGETRADTNRALLAFSLRRMPLDWKPTKENPE